MAREARAKEAIGQCTGERAGVGRAEHIRAALGKFLLMVNKQTSEVHDPNVTKKG